MCLGSVCHVFTTSHRHIMYWQRKNFLPTIARHANDKVLCHSSPPKQVVLRFIVLLAPSRDGRSFASLWNFSMKTFCCPSQFLVGWFSEMQFQWSSQIFKKSVIKFFKVPKPVECWRKNGFLCKTGESFEHQAHIDFRGRGEGREMFNFHLKFPRFFQIKHIINIQTETLSSPPDDSYRQRHILHDEISIFSYFSRQLTAFSYHSSTSDFFPLLFSYEMMSTHSTFNSPSHAARVYSSSKVWEKYGGKIKL